MADNTALLFTLPPDFAQRCAAVRTRQSDGQVTTLQCLADGLGLPFEFIAAALSITEALMTGRRVLIDPAPAPKPH